MASFEDAVRDLLEGAVDSREEWGECWDKPPIDDDTLVLVNLIELIREQGKALRVLAVDEETSADVEAAIRRAREALPGQLGADLYAPTVTTPAELLGDVVEVVGAQRIAIRRLATEQLVSTDEIDKQLDECPVPDEDAPDLIERLGSAVDADSEALLIIAQELDWLLADD